MQFYQFCLSNTKITPAKHNFTNLGNVSFLCKLLGKYNVVQKWKKMVANERCHVPLSHSNPLAGGSLFQISARTQSPSDTKSLTRLLKITSQLQDMHIISGKHFCKLSNSSTAQSDDKTDRKGRLKSGC